MHFHRADVSYLVMDAIEGVTLESCFRDLSQAQLTALAQTLKAWAIELQELGRRSSHRSTMGSWPEGPFCNVFFTRSPHDRFQVDLPSAEYQNMDEFHAYWLERLGDHRRVLEEASTKYRGVSEDVVLAHGDLNADNIVVSIEGDCIVSILDWDSLGWWPAFWDPMCMIRGGRWSREWCEALEAVFGRPRNELGAVYSNVLDCLSQDYFTVVNREAVLASRQRAPDADEST